MRTSLPMGCRILKKTGKEPSRFNQVNLAGFIAPIEGVESSRKSFVREPDTLQKSCAGYRISRLCGGKTRALWRVGHADYAKFSGFLRIPSIEALSTRELQLGRTRRANLVPHRLTADSFGELVNSFAPLSLADNFTGIQIETRLERRLSIMERALAM